VNRTLWAQSIGPEACPQAASLTAKRSDLI